MLDNPEDQPRADFSSESGQNAPPSFGRPGPPPSKTPRRLGFGFVGSLALFCITRGYSAVNAPPTWVSAIGWFGAGAALLISAVWIWEYTADRHVVIRWVISFLVLAVLAILAFPSVSLEYKKERADKGKNVPTPAVEKAVESEQPHTPAASPPLSKRSPHHLLQHPYTHHPRLRRFHRRISTFTIRRQF
jgi:hypothetical protein